MLWQAYNVTFFHVSVEGVFYMDISIDNKKK